MNILYLITNVTGDELAIQLALESLGNTVEIVNDAEWGHPVQPMYIRGFDLLLFNHSRQLEKIGLSGLPKVFWCFDLMTETPERWEWVQSAIQISDLGFFTDGGCVDEYPNKAIRLMQGAQQVKRGTPRDYNLDVVFAGSIDHPRSLFLEEIDIKFPSMLTTITHKARVFGGEFAGLVASSKIMIAPDTPIKHNYWSNRVYMVLGYGGFLLHPYIEELAGQYVDGKEIVFYHSREDLYNKIDYYLQSDLERWRISTNGMNRTKWEHTYTHRCRTMLQHIQERSLIHERST